MAEIKEEDKPLKLNERLTPQDTFLIRKACREFLKERENINPKVDYKNNPVGVRER